MRLAARVYPDYAARLKERNLVVQFRLRDKPEGRWIKIDNGKISIGSAASTRLPISSSSSRTGSIAESFLTPPFNLLERVDAAKNFKVRLRGSDELAVWFLGRHGPAGVGHVESRNRHGQRRHPLHLRHQRRPDLRLCEETARSSAPHRSTSPMRTRRPGPSPHAARRSRLRGGPRWARMACARSPWCIRRAGCFTR